MFGQRGIGLLVEPDIMRAVADVAPSTAMLLMTKARGLLISWATPATVGPGR